MGRKPKLPDPDMYAVAAAYLSGKGESQEQIADILNVSQPAVCRLLNGPVAKSCLKISNPEFSCPKELQPLWDKAQTTFFPCTDLLEKLQATCRNGRSFLQKVVLVYGHAGEGIGPAVVPAVEDVLGKAGILGITWGKTISDLIEMLQVHLRAPLRSQNPVNIFPVCGEPLKDRKQSLRNSSSHLALKLDRLVNGQREEVPPSLAGVPLFIPRKGFSDCETRAIRRFVHLVAGYSQVFGTGEKKDGGWKESLVGQADTFFTSVGSVEGARRGIFLRERVELGDLTEDDLVNWVAGDIGGILIPRRGLAAQPAKAVEVMNSRWLGFSQEHVKHCAERALREERPGVVVFAIQARRAAIVLRIVEENLVSQLIIDHALLVELKASLAQPQE